MNIEQERRHAIGLHDLRIKELRSKLSLSEQMELEELLTVQNEKQPGFEQMQVHSEVILYAIRNYTWKDMTPEPTFLQKLVKAKPAPKSYKLSFPELPDADEEGFMFSLMLDFRQIMEDVGLGTEWPKMLPAEWEVYYGDTMDDGEKEWFDTLPDPAWCHAKLIEAKGLEEKVAQHGEEMIELLAWVIEYWGNGYQIYADMADVFDYYGEGI
ncbi:hypothetical protein M3197_13030 [Sporosarcina aquimarina]|uniref:hypothetical protein n=1 Tax=Sporosarcina aquimarina TaxID=114975 RepID=UPI00203F9A53|nr:hypothetical protein [Sporosarcina aquimarina]MCM3758387.1 hypothetical protein [Sporosarcina aquimarina]